MVLGGNATTGEYAYYYSFIYGDGTASTNSTGAYQFIARASGGFQFYDNTNSTPDVTLSGQVCFRFQYWRRKRQCPRRHWT